MVVLLINFHNLVGLNLLDIQPRYEEVQNDFPDILVPIGSERNKYRVWHDKIINYARHRSSLNLEGEWHHILPRSLDGSDKDENLVKLSYREHFLIHWLLTKFYTGKARIKMLHALRLMITRAKSSWQYEVSQRAASLSMVGNKNWEHRTLTEEGRIRLRNGKLGNKDWLGRTHTLETRIKLSAVNKGRKRTPETVELIRSKRLGKKDPPSTVAKKKEILGRKKTCEYCGKEVNLGNYASYHGLKCKSLR